MQNPAFGVKREQPVLVTLVLALGIFLVPFDVTVVVVAQPGITKSLDFSVDGAAWVLDEYSLVFTGALLASGALAGSSAGAVRCWPERDVSGLLHRIRWRRLAMLLAARAVKALGGLFGHGHARAHCQYVSQWRAAGAGVRHCRGRFRRRHGFGSDLGRLARLVVRMAVDLLRQYSLLSGADPRGAEIHSGSPRPERATPRPARHRVADGIAGPGSRRAAQTRRPWA